MGGLRRKMPTTYWTFLISTLALAGVPMFAGYYSKDQIIATAMAWGMEHGAAAWMPFLFGAVGAFMTTFYMFRVIFLTFHGEPQVAEKYQHAHESPLVMTLPLVVLATFAVLGGGTMNPLPDIDGLDRYRLSGAELAWVEAWQAFVQRIESDHLPGFPIWVDAFHATPRIPGGTPAWKANFLEKNSAPPSRTASRIWPAWKDCGWSIPTITF